MSNNHVPVSNGMDAVYASSRNMNHKRDQGVHTRDIGNEVLQGFLLVEPGNLDIVLPFEIRLVLTT